MDRMKNDMMNVLGIISALSIIQREVTGGGRGKYPGTYVVMEPNPFIRLLQL